MSSRWCETLSTLLSTVAFSACISPNCSQSTSLTFQSSGGISKHRFLGCIPESCFLGFHIDKVIDREYPSCYVHHLPHQSQFICACRVWTSHMRSMRRADSARGPSLPLLQKRPERVHPSCGGLRSAMCRTSNLVRLLACLLQASYLLWCASNMSVFSF